MTTAGWFFLVAAWTAIIAVTAYCYKLILAKPSKHPESDNPPPTRM